MEPDRFVYIVHFWYGNDRRPGRMKADHSYAKGEEFDYCDERAIVRSCAYVKVVAPRAPRNYGDRRPT